MKEVCEFVIVIEEKQTFLKHCDTNIISKCIVM